MRKAQATAQKSPPTVVAFPGKTEQRITKVISYLRKHAGRQHTYDDLVQSTGAAYDSLLYILGTLVEVELVQRTEVPSGPGRPKVFFQWIGGARSMGGRLPH